MKDIFTDKFKEKIIESLESDYDGDTFDGDILDVVGKKSKPKAAGLPNESTATGLQAELPDMEIYEIASVIKQSWPKVNFAAVPYLRAMNSMSSIDDKYGLDDGRGIVAYFLSNASSWRGEVAKLVKVELKRRLSGR